MPDDKRHLPVLGPSAQSFEQTLNQAEQGSFHGTGDGNTPATEGSWAMGMSAKNRVPWFEVVPPEHAHQKFADNYNRIQRAQAKAKDPERPTNILLLSASGRNNKLSCAHELANSTKVIQNTKKLFSDAGLNARHIDLWDLNIEHCNGCYGSHDAWCHWPCTCWPFDDMIDLYEAFTVADGIVIGSPVNEASAASRFFEMWHRFISMDGGLDFMPPEGWQKSTEALKAMKDTHGHDRGIKHVLRWANKPFGVIVLGHELGAQTATNQITASIQYRGGYVPPGCMVPKIYMGAGPAHLDDEVVNGDTPFRHELNQEIATLVETLGQHANLYRQLPREADGGDRT